MFRRCRNRLIICVGVQRVAIVIDGIQSLQSRADVIEIDFLRVQRSSGRLDVVLEHLRSRRCLVFLAHGFGPNAARHPSNDSVFRVDAVGKEEAEVGTKGIQIHAPTQVVFHIRESIGQGEGQLGNGIGSCLGDVVTADGNRIEVLDVAVNEALLHVAHQT